MSRDSIKPDVTMFTAAGIEEMEGKPIVALRVQKDTSAPPITSPAGVFGRRMFT